jgi:hypothetical protein
MIGRVYPMPSVVNRSARNTNIAGAPGTGGARHDGQHVADGEIAEPLVDTHLQQNGLHREVRQQYQQQPEGGSEIHALPGITADELLVARAVMPRRDRRNRHHDAEAQCETEEPDAPPHGYCRERFRAEAPRHDGIGELHARYRQVVDDERPGEAQQGPDLRSPVLRSPHGRQCNPSAPAIWFRVWCKVIGAYRTPV